jgi:F-type H+-transporting ATPase subunit b
MSLLQDSYFVVGISFVLFFAILAYLGVPGRLGAMLDARAAKIRADLDEARRLREEAQSLLSSYERKQKDVERLAAEIVERARADAAAAAEDGKAALERTVARRLKAAEDQIASAEAKAVREIRERAAQIAVAAAAEVIALRMTDGDAGALIDRAIAETARRLN